MNKRKVREVAILAVSACGGEDCGSWFEPYQTTGEAWSFA
jgi:hypothetical protein